MCVPDHFVQPLFELWMDRKFEHLFVVFFGMSKDKKDLILKPIKRDTNSNIVLHPQLTGHGFLLLCTIQSYSLHFVYYLLLDVSCIICCFWQICWMFCLPKGDIITEVILFSVSSLLQAMARMRSPVSLLITDFIQKIGFEIHVMKL